MRTNINGVVGNLTNFPGNSQIVVSSHVFLPENKRGKGLGNEAHTARLELCKTLGYNLVLCTVCSKNKIQQHLLSKNGWKEIDSFVSDYTGNKVLLYSKKL